jgi:type II secretory pathway predicted ATPase ExeA
MKRPTATDMFDQPPREDPFPYRDYVAARESLLVAIKEGPFYGLVLGETGTGKSTLPREIAQGLDRNCRIVYLSSSRASPLGICNFLAESLRVPARRSHAQTVKAIAECLKGQPVHYVFWCDEGHTFSEESLALVPVIAESDLSVRQLVSVVLSGLPSLWTVLDQPSLFPLKRRIGVRCTLAGLRRDELDAFLVHRLGGAAAPHLTVPAKDQIFECAKGSPALVAKAARAVLRRSGDGPVTEDTTREGINDAGP